MGFFEKIFGARKQIVPDSYFRTFSAYTPVFTAFNKGVYESDLVRAAINARAVHVSKMQIQIEGTARPKLQTRLKTAPNDFMTWSQFLYRLSTILDVQNTAFIVPVLDAMGETIGIYPVLPSKCELKAFKNEPYLVYSFSDGRTAAIEFSMCGIMTKYQYSDDFKGDSNAALQATMALIDIQNQGIKEGVKSAATYRFMATLNNFAKAEDLKKEREKFNAASFAGEGAGGVLLFPNSYNNIKQIDSKPFVVDAAQMEIIQRNVFNYFGVNEKILQNKANADEMESFFNGAIEPFAIQLSDVLTRMLFTPIERNRNHVYVTSNRLQYMSVDQKVNLATQLGDRGMITINEIRELFNYAPVDGGDERPIRGEYYMAGEKED